MNAGIEALPAARVQALYILHLEEYPGPVPPRKAAVGAGISVLHRHRACQAAGGADRYLGTGLAGVHRDYAGACVAHRIQVQSFVVSSYFPASLLLTTQWQCQPALHCTPSSTSRMTYHAVPLEMDHAALSYKVHGRL